LPGTGAGWTVRYTTELTEEVWFYLRGEEYSAQIDYFVKSIEQQRTDGKNTFRSALEADRVVAMILAQQTGAQSLPVAQRGGDAKRGGLWSRLFG